jgi:hypothetical protein
MKLLLLTCFILPLGANEGEIVPAEHIRASLERMMSQDTRKQELLHQRRQHKREFNSDGTLKSETVLDLRLDPWDEFVVTRVIARNEQPLSDKEKADQEERLRKQVQAMRRNPPKSRAEKEESWMRELPDALVFRRAGVEDLGGRRADVLTFEPRPGYKAKHMRAKLFEKIRGTIWMDQAENELVKVDVLVFDDVSIGFGILAKLEKGTHFEMQRKKWESGVWFEEWQRLRYDARLLIKPMRQEVETRWKNVSIKPSPKS